MIDTEEDGCIFVDRWLTLVVIVTAIIMTV